jgi:hypothetical protein
MIFHLLLTLMLGKADLGALASSDFQERPPSCGTYEITGVWKAKRQLVLYPGTEGEFTLELTPEEPVRMALIQKMRDLDNSKERSAVHLIGKVYQLSKQGAHRVAVNELDRNSTIESGFSLLKAGKCK